MIVGTRGSVLRLIAWQWRGTTYFAIGGVLAVLVHQVWHFDHLLLPTTPLAVVGAALGIFVSFRTNSAYDRWWEGRKLWGRLVNVSRHFTSQALSYLPGDEAGRKLAREIVVRHITYVHTLRCLLRLQPLHADSELLRLHDEETLSKLAAQSNATHALLHEQSLALAQQGDEGRLEPRRLQSMDESLRVMLDVQGGCERIKKTPLPRGYGFIAQQLIQAYGLLFPLAIVEELGWLTVPINVLVCLSFALISEAGRVLEDPFNMFFNGLPLRALSLTIERNLRERLGDTELPEIPQADARGILM